MGNRSELYYATLIMLREKEGLPATMSKSAAARYLKISRGTLNDLIWRNKIATKDGKITIGELAKYLTPTQSRGF